MLEVALSPLLVEREGRPKGTVEVALGPREDSMDPCPAHDGRVADA
jgi:hypothetical protein